jgi:hypothetical protein
VIPCRRTVLRHKAITRERGAFVRLYGGCQSLDDVVAVSLRDAYGRVSYDEDAETIRDLVLNHGVPIDEAARKFELTPARVCRIVGWV